METVEVRGIHSGQLTKLAKRTAPSEGILYAASFNECVIMMQVEEGAVSLHTKDLYWGDITYHICEI